MEQFTRMGVHKVRAFLMVGEVRASRAWPIRAEEHLACNYVSVLRDDGLSRVVFLACVFWPRDVSHAVVVQRVPYGVFRVSWMSPKIVGDVTFDICTSL